MRWGNGVGRLGIVGYECEILISESEKLLSDYEGIAGSVEYSFTIRSHHKPREHNLRRVEGDRR